MVAIPVCYRIPAPPKPAPLERSAQETLALLMEREAFLLADKQRIAGLLDGLAVREKVTQFRLEIVQRNIAAIRQLVGELEPLPF